MNINDRGNKRAAVYADTFGKTNRIKMVFLLRRQLKLVIIIFRTKSIIKVLIGSKNVHVTGMLYIHINETPF
jgi:hypothetical protein